ncbi:hypothetical protein [Breoghania sp.]|uniref:hypothetical protein n=1 Tax=Breoghania sp. TaxID=2065378 RepID=UPI002AA77E3D|nr:hypothetical protein [Breoghania sp.]
MSEAIQKAPFSQYPTEAQIEDFVRHLKETGKPHTWHLIDNSKPPKAGEFIEVVTFKIPPRLRGRVGKAPCPICSPDKPKYYEGALTWFKCEGVVRAIGKDCAHTHFGAELTNAARAKGKHRRQLVAAQGWLENTLPRVPALQAEAAALQETAVDADKVLRKIWAASSKKDISRIAKIAKDRPLTIETKRQVVAVDEIGRETVDYITQVLSRFPISGANFLTPRTLLQAQAQNTLHQLASVKLPDDCEDDLCVMSFILKLGEDAGPMELERVTREAIKALETLKQSLAEARLFLSEANLQRLADWSADYRSGSPFELSLSAGYPAVTFRKRKPNGRVHFVIPETLRSQH